MNSSLVIEVKKPGWAISFKPYHFLNEFTIGGPNCDIVVPGCAADIILSVSITIGMLNFAVSGGLIKETKTTSYQCDVTSESHLHVLTADYEASVFSIVVHYVAKKKAITCDQCFPIPEDKRIVVGAEKNADIQVEHSLVKGNLFSLTRKTNFWLLEPNGMIPLGLYVNTERVEKPKQWDVICQG